MYNLVEICSPICLMGVLGSLVSESAAIAFHLYSW